MDAEAVYLEYDAAKRSYDALAMTNVADITSWTAQKRLAFDRAWRSARDRLNRAMVAREALLFPKPPRPSA